MPIADELAEFAHQEGFRGKGPLCVALVVTDHARQMGLPLNPDALITDGKGQVLGLGAGKVQSILNRHGIERLLAAEGGRTSRGSMGNMQTYVAWLNAKHEADGSLDIDEVERFWVEQVRTHFAAMPFNLKLDGSLSLRRVIRAVMDQAEARQKEVQGTMFLGTMMQHMVGAKLDVVLGIGEVEHNSSNANDQYNGRTGDFDVGDVSIHVSTSPSEALLQKCKANLEAGKKPIIVTLKRGVTVAEALAENAGIADRVDVLEFEQFFTTNIYELGRFKPEDRITTVNSLVERYNAIVDEHETDPSLRIRVAEGR